MQEFCDFSGTWDLFDTPKDVLFPETLVLSNIFGFPAMNWVPKWTKTVNFGCIPFEPKFKIWNDFLNSVGLIGRLPLFKISARSNNISGLAVSKIPHVRQSHP